MSILFVVLILVILLFGYVVFFGAPYVPTLGKQTQTALDLLDLKPGQTLLELGCGDGKVMIAAAKQGIHVVGYELNPILAAIAWLRTRRFGSNVQVVWGNYWHKDWPLTDGIFVFLLDKYMTRLDNLVIQKYQGKKIKLVSFAFEISDKKPVKKRDGLFLYQYGD